MLLFEYPVLSAKYIPKAHNFSEQLCAHRFLLTQPNVQKTRNILSHHMNIQAEEMFTKNIFESKMCVLCSSNLKLLRSPYQSFVQ